MAERTGRGVERILVADDEPANVTLLEHLLARAGYRDVVSTTQSNRVIPLITEAKPDLVLLDLRMPRPDGYDILGQLPTVVPSEDYLPVLVLTADVTQAALHRALDLGAHDFLTKPFDPREVVLRMRNLLRTRALHLELREQNEILEERVRERTERLIQAEKLSAMGQLLAGVAHELNNPLAVVAGQAALLQHMPGKDPAARADKIVRAAERCVRIVRNFLKLARQWPPERSATELNTIVREAVELLSYELRTDDIEVQLELAEGLPTIWADPHQLHQVLVNLIANAHHALRQSPRPRTLAIRTAHEAERDRLILVVADSGPGVPPEIRSRIFDPFFTTKPVGQGTGLGLSLSAGVIVEHGGTLHLESTPGTGATFRIEIPVVAPPVERRVPTLTREEVAAVRGRRVLVVDDEPDVAAILVDLLRLDDHVVDVVEDGQAALNALATGRYDLILSDTKMPGLDGPGFYRELGARYPRLLVRIAFITGDTLNPDKRAFFEQANAPLITKPFALDDVRQVVRRLLQA
jgi:signal transduction histidine kinase